MSQQASYGQEGGPQTTQAEEHLLSLLQDGSLHTDNFPKSNLIVLELIDLAEEVQAAADVSAQEKATNEALKAALATAQAETKKIREESE